MVFKFVRQGQRLIFRLVGKRGASCDEMWAGQRVTEGSARMGVPEKKECLGEKRKKKGEKGRDRDERAFDSCVQGRRKGEKRRSAKGETTVGGKKEIVMGKFERKKHTMPQRCELSLREQRESGDVGKKKNDVGNQKEAQTERGPRGTRKSVGICCPFHSKMVIRRMCEGKGSIGGGGRIIFQSRGEKTLAMQLRKNRNIGD